MNNELTIPEAVELAIALHRSGRAADAFEVYARILRTVPEQPDALHYMGILAQEQGRADQAMLLIARSVELVPDRAAFRANFGNILFANERFDEAQREYDAALVLDRDHVETLNNYGVLCKGTRRFDASERYLLRAIELVPDFIGARNNLAGLYMEIGRVPEAIEQVCEALARSPKGSKPRELLGIAYCRLGRLDLAEQVYRDWLADEPDNPWPRHLLAACTGRDVPSRASDAFVRSEFDGFADSFDEKLSKLQYRTPELMRAALRSSIGTRADLDVLDAGCGTGLCGLFLREFARYLVGVDLSSRMLARARQRNLYNDLVEGELTGYMLARPDSFDVIVSADTLVYFGSLEEVLSAAARSLRSSGTLCFSVEAADENEGSGFRLNHHGRYAHTARYVKRCLSSCGLQLTQMEAVVLRLEGGDPVSGWLVMATR